MEDKSGGDSGIDDDDDGGGGGRIAREMICKTAEILFGCRGSCEVRLKGEENRG
jgi:hypothetical protein